MNPRSVLVVAAHPDDEVLGCGGTISKLSRKGAKVHVAFLADGVSSRAPEKPNARELAARRNAARTACRVLGAQPPTFFDFPDNRLDTVPLLTLAKAVESLTSAHAPEAVFTHAARDLNIDHEMVHRAVATACRPQGKHPVKTLLCFEVPSSTEWQPPGSAPAFEPNWFEDISQTLALKMRAMAAYSRELRAWPHPRSQKGILALAQWRGATISAAAAEAFVLARHLG